GTGVAGDQFREGRLAVGALAPSFGLLTSPVELAVFRRGDERTGALPLVASRGSGPVVERRDQAVDVGAVVDLLGPGLVIELAASGPLGQVLGAEFVEHAGEVVRGGLAVLAWPPPGGGLSGIRDHSETSCPCSWW